MNKIAIVGLGGVGGYISANFVRSNIDVVGFAKGKHLKALAKGAMKIIEDGKEWEAKVNAKSKPDFDDRFDIVIFCTKSYDLNSAYKLVENSIDNSTLLLSLSNGVDNGQRLKSFKKGDVIEGCIYILSSIKSEGVIEKKGSVFSVVIDANHPKAKMIENIFLKANLRVKMSKDIKKDLWKKYLFISSFANLTTLYDKSINDIYKEHFNEIKNFLKEVVLIANHIGVDIKGEDEKALEIAKNLPENSTTSMWLDYKNKKRCEFDSLSKYLVDLAISNNIKANTVLNVANKVQKLCKEI